VELNLADFIVIAVLVGAGFVLSFVGLWLMLRQVVHEQQRSTTRQLNEFAGTLKALETRLAELSRTPAMPPAAAPAGIQTPVAAAMPVPAAPQQEEVTPEILVVIAAAVTAFLGKKVRIRSAKMLGSRPQVANPWSQQGRALIQASHHLRFRG
jgi:methylmalonyl-CoA carboxyltransferase large subunit